MGIDGNYLAPTHLDDVNSMIQVLAAIGKSVVRIPAHDHGGVVGQTFDPNVGHVQLQPGPEPG